MELHEALEKLQYGAYHKMGGCEEVRTLLLHIDKSEHGMSKQGEAEKIVRDAFLPLSPSEQIELCKKVWGS